MKRIDQLKQQREELDKRIKKMAAMEISANRKEDAKRKIIIGAWVLNNRPALVKEIIANLTREQDKVAFENFVLHKVEPAPSEVTNTISETKN